MSGLKQAEHFEDDDDNDNDSDDVEDVSVHGLWITLRYARRQAIWSSRVIFVFLDAPAVRRVILNDRQTWKQIDLMAIDSPERRREIYGLTLGGNMMQ